MADDDTDRRSRSGGRPRDRRDYIDLGSEADDRGRRAARASDREERWDGARSVAFETSRRSSDRARDEAQDNYPDDDQDDDGGESVGDRGRRDADRSADADRRGRQQNEEHPAAKDRTGRDGSGAMGGPAMRNRAAGIRMLNGAASADRS